ncbi:PREDICTED: cytochrome b561 and DOMON domain-containing protein At3g59070-like [Tarenaya hassleriana]|uniref:cytochrome b561 and DOMON domain-containing protein At3g59070-like n=1 Tax=Tarenaya hassleriana TaxID=28532 RepID=UPI00053C7D29|nr:PREDICTED: cytochrome b561 and DOMON domain-containing protein At3g59070-like [Tarenaya hassleriana]
MSMISWKLLFAVSCLLSLLSFCSAVQTCESRVFSGGRTFRTCSDLPVLDSFIHFSYVQETGVLDVAYRHAKMEPSSWVSWAINPRGHGMSGAQSVVAYRNSTTGLMRAYTSPIASYSTILQEGPLSFKANNISAEYSSDSEMTIFATLVLPPNTTVVNHLWQDGPVLEGGRLGMHAMGGDHLKSMGTLDLLSGRVLASKGGGPTTYMSRVKNAHGIINAVSWGFLMPLGGLAARYMKTYDTLDPMWFYIHVICQSLGYFIGLSGGLGTAIFMWRSTGFRLGPHSIIGVVLFILGFLQILALKARPDKDHKYRRYWNWYHHAVGYVVIGLSIYNIYKGLAILQPANTWRIVYTAAIGFVGLVAIVMEIVQFEKQWGWIFSCCRGSNAKDAGSIEV